MEEGIVERNVAFQVSKGHLESSMRVSSSILITDGKLLQAIHFSYVCNEAMIKVILAAMDKDNWYLVNQ